MNIFITGGAGFIGTSLVERLLATTSENITVYDNFSSAGQNMLEPFRTDGRLRVIEADLLDADKITEAIAGHHMVYHLASNPDISRGIEDPELDYKQSIEATFNVLDAMRLTGIRKILFTSGSGIYGDSSGQPTAENFGPLLPVSMYGAGKLAAEALISSFSHMFGLTSYIFRMANVVGARQTHGVILDFVRKLKENPSELLILGDGKQSKSYIHVHDVLDGFEYVLTKCRETVNVFNIATDDYVTVDQIAKTVIQEMQIDNPQIKYSGGSRGWPGDVPVVRIDASKLASLGYHPKLSSQQAIHRATKEILGK
jgi:UDP-glucose 4-epimerase